MSTENNPMVSKRQDSFQGGRVGLVTADSKVVHVIAMFLDGEVDGETLYSGEAVFGELSFGKAWGVGGGRT